MEKITDILLSDSEIDRSLIDSLECDDEDFIFMIPFAIDIACRKIKSDASKNIPLTEILHKRDILQRNIKKLTTLCFIKEIEGDSIVNSIPVPAILDIIEVKEKKVLALNRVKRIFAVASTLLIGIYVFTYGVNSKFMGLCLILMLLSNGLIFGRTNKCIDACVRKVNLVLSAKKELNL